MNPSLLQGFSTGERQKKSMTIGVIHGKGSAKKDPRVPENENKKYN